MKAINLKIEIDTEYRLYYIAISKHIHKQFKIDGFNI